MHRGVDQAPTGAAVEGTPGGYAAQTVAVV